MYRTTSFNDSEVQTQGIYQFIPPDLRRMFYKNPAAIHASHNGLDPYGFMTRGLVLYLPLWALKDSSFKSVDAYRHTCTVTGAVWGPQGRTFTAASDHRISVGATSDTELQFLNGGTFIVWFNASAIDTEARSLMSKSNITGEDRVNLYLNSSATSTTELTGFIETNNAGNLFATATADEYTKDTWAMGAFTFGAGNGTIYFNGVASGSTVSPVDDLQTGTHSTLKLGRDFNDDYEFDGILGEAWAYGRILPAGEIAHIYNCTRWRYQ